MNNKRKGERLEAGQYNENTSEHLHRYALAAELCFGKTVLDIACGDGYGSNLIANKALAVTGVDIDAATVENARKKYQKPNLRFKTGNAAAIPCDDNQFEAVVSFETLEHHDQHDEMMKEIKRVMQPDGFCIISTPDKLIYTDKKNYRNPYHVKELYKEEFTRLLKKYFSNVELYNQRFFSGSMILPEQKDDMPVENFEGDFTTVKKIEQLEAEYLIAFASDTQLSLPKPSLFIDHEFGQNKILEFQQYSLRYKIGDTVLKPIRFVKDILGIK